MGSKRYKLIVLTGIVSLFFAACLMGCVQNSDNSKFSYKVEYYLENLAGEYEKAEDLCYLSAAPAKSEVTAAEKTPAGFSVDGDSSFVSAVIDDNSTVLKVYYKRNDLDYSVNYYFADSSGTYEKDEELSYNAQAKYGMTVAAREITREGMTMDADLSNSSAVLTENDKELNVYYKKLSFEYSVKYYTERDDGSFTEAVDESYVAVAEYGQTVTAENKSFTGFGFCAGLSLTTTEVKAENVVLKLYYSRNVYNYTVTYFFENALGEYEENSDYGFIGSAYYNELVTVSPVPVDGYTFNVSDSLPSTRISTENNAIYLYYDIKETEHHNTKVSVFCDSIANEGYEQTDAYSSDLSVEEEILKATDEKSQHFDYVGFYAEDVSETETLLFLYFNRKYYTVTEEYYIPSGKDYVLADGYTRETDCKYGTFFSMQEREITGFSVDYGHEDNFTSSVVEGNVTLRLYYDYKKYDVLLTDIFEENPWGESYAAVLSGISARVFTAEKEYACSVDESGTLSARLPAGVYRINVMHESFFTSYDAVLTVSEEKIFTEVFSVVSEPKANITAIYGNATLDGTGEYSFNAEYGIWYDSSDESETYSLVTPIASQSLTVSVTVTAKHEGNYSGEMWSETSAKNTSAGISFVNAALVRNRLYIGACAEGVYIKAFPSDNYSYIRNEAFASNPLRADSGLNVSDANYTVNHSTVLSVSRSGDNSVYIYRDGIYMCHIDKSGYVIIGNSVVTRLSDNWPTYLGTASVAALEAFGLDADQFSFGNIQYSVSALVSDGFKGFSLNVDGDSEISVPSFIAAGESFSLTLSVPDGKILYGIKINDNKYLPVTVEENRAESTLCVTATGGTSPDKTFKIEYREEEDMNRIEGRVKLDEWYDGNLQSAYLEFKSAITLVTYKVFADANGYYNVLLPEGDYSVRVFHPLLKLTSEAQSLTADGDKIADYVAEFYDVANIPCGAYEDYIRKFEDLAAFTFNGKVNAQKIEDLGIEKFYGDFAFSFDMIQAYCNSASIFGTNDYASGFLIGSDAGKLAVYFNGGNIRIMPRVQWSSRVEFANPAGKLFLTYEQTAHNLAFIKRGNALYLAVDEKIVCSVSEEGVFDAYGALIAQVNADFKDFMRAFFASSSYSLGVGSGVNIVPGNYHNYDRTGFAGIKFTADVSVIASLVEEKFNFRVSADEGATVTVVGEGVDYSDKTIKAGSNYRVIVSANDGQIIESIKINGTDRYFSRYDKVLYLDEKALSHTQIEVVTAPAVVRTITGRTTDKNATVTLFASACTYETDTDGDGNFTFKTESKTGYIRIAFSDGNVRNIAVDGDGDVDLGEIALQQKEWATYTTEVEAAMDVVASDDERFVFAIGTSERTSDGKGKFYVYDVIADKVIAKPEFNLGNCRQIDYENGFCYVTSREDGLWVIDVTDPYNPVLGSHYDTSEMATGITVYSNTVFVANRQYGVDVIDVTDPYNPMFLTRIKTGEVQSLDVYEDTLFAGIWGEQKVLVVDISDISAPEILYGIPLDGRGDGVFVQNGVLYAATGHHARGDSSTTSSPAYGKGNGLEAFEISKDGYVKLFGVKFDLGYEPGFDMWEAIRAGNYVYVANTFNGVFVFDITDIKNPVKVANIKCDLPQKGTNNVTGLAIINGSLFATGGKGGLFRLNDSDIVSPLGDEQRRGELPEMTASSFDSSVRKGIAENYLLSSSGQVRSVAVNEGYIFTASGSEGICVYNRITEKIVNKIPTGYFVKEILLDGDYVFTAEDLGGVAVYLIDDLVNGGEVTPVARYTAEELGDTTYVTRVETVRITGDKENAFTVNQRSVVKTYNGISEIRLSKVNDFGKRFMLLHAGGSWGYVADATDITDIRVVYKFAIHTGLMYSRNFSDETVDDKYFVIGANSFGIAYLDVSGTYSTFETNYWHNGYNGGTAAYFGFISNGICTVNHSEGDAVLFSTNAGIRILEKNTKSFYEAQAYPAALGWPRVFEDIMVLSNRAEGIISLYDVSELTSPVLIAEIYTNGLPDIAAYYDGKVYVPVGQYGLLVIKTN